MIRTTVVATLVIFMAVVIYLLEEMVFLIPYKGLLIDKYAPAIGIFSGVLLLNLFAGIYHLRVKLFFKTTGRKLSHVDRQLRSGAAISTELAGRLSR